MTIDRIYFDNAASSFPKPEPVVEAMVDFLRTCGNPGRGAHSFALEGARRIFEARETIASFLGIGNSERLVFTGGCTTSINIVLKGLAGNGEFKQGDSVLVSSLEHNSVMRPLAQLKESHGISFLPCSFDEGFETRLQEMVEKHAPRLVALTWASNVTGEVLPVLKVAQYLRDKRIPFLVDGAQTAGKFEINLDDSGITFFCASGHKGLMGAPGVGLLYVSKDANLHPLIAGGTGSRSESLEVPTAYPDRLEAGTLPGPAIAALGAGVEWLKEKGVEKILKAETVLAQKFLGWAEENNYIKIYGTVPSKSFSSAGQVIHMPVFSFSMRGLTPSQLADELDTKYGIAVRSGLHCSALAHEQLGTLETGLVRVSFGPFNTSSELDTLLSALEEIAAQTRVRRAD